MLLIARTILLASLSVIYVSCLPIYSTDAPSLLVPDNNLLHDSLCIRDIFSEAVPDLVRHYISTGRIPLCEVLSGLSQWQLFEVLQRNVELLGTISNPSALPNYSDNLCRLRNTVLPFLNDTLINLNVCEDSVSLESNNGETVEELCIVKSISSALNMLLSGINEDSRIDTSGSVRSCRINFAARYLFDQLRERVSNLQLNERPTACPPSPIPSDLSSSCLSQANLAILNHVPAALLENYGSVMQGIASDIQLLLPELESFTGEPRPECVVNVNLSDVNGYCLTRLLRTTVSSLYSSLRGSSSIELAYQECQSDDAMVSGQSISITTTEGQNS